MISYIIFMDQRGVTTRTACWGLTLFLFKLVLCQEDGPHQFPHRRLNRYKEFLGVSTEKERCQRRRGHLIQQFCFISWRCIQGRASSYPNTPVAPRLFLFDMKLRGAERPKDKAGSPQLEVCCLCRVAEIDAQHSRGRLARRQQLCRHTATAKSKERNEGAPFSAAALWTGIKPVLLCRPCHRVSHSGPVPSQRAFNISCDQVVKATKLCKPYGKARWR